MPAWNALLATYPQLLQTPGTAPGSRTALMQLSGTSVAAPAVAGAAALLLQANPGLTPPLVKAILQYSALPLAQGSLLEQGTGALNVEGAVRLAQALRTDLGSALAAGTLKAGDNLLASRPGAADAGDACRTACPCPGAAWCWPAARAWSAATRCSRAGSRSTTRA